MREQFQRDNATQEILCPMVGPAKCAVAKDACQIFDGVTMDAVRGMESQCLQSGYLIEEDEDVSTTELETSASGREILSLFMVQLLQLTFVLGNVLISTSAVSWVLMSVHPPADWNHPKGRPSFADDEMSSKQMGLH